MNTCWQRLCVVLSFLLVFFFLGCSGKQATPSADANGEQSQDTETGDADTAADPLFDKAQDFDRYLGAQMDSGEAEDYVSDCKENPADDLFCFSVINKDALDQKGRGISKSAKAVFCPKNLVVVPHFHRRKITNWSELRSAPVPAVLKGVGTLSPSELQKVRKMALDEKRCPNNVAIAAAATLEELLPDRIDPEEIGKLYEKGAQCLGSNPTDKETLLTRAGLFFFMHRNYKRAAKIFARSSSIPERVRCPRTLLVVPIEACLGATERGGVGLARSPHPIPVLLPHFGCSHSNESGSGRDSSTCGSNAYDSFAAHNRCEQSDRASRSAPPLWI